MNYQEQSCNWNYAAEMDVAERKLSAFIAVTQLFGPEKAKLAAPGDASHFPWAKSGEYITHVSSIGPLGWNT